MKRLWVLSLALCLLLPSVTVAAQTKIYPAPSRFSVTITPATNDGAALGTSSLRWSDLFIASGGVINFAGGTMLTDGSNTLTLAGGQFIFPNGTALLPSVAVGSATYGLYFDGSSALYLTLAGEQRFNIDVGGSPITYNFSTDTATLRLGVNADVLVGREAAAILQMGADAASPVAQTFKGPDGSGADAAGGNITFAPGRGTGTALGGSYFIATAPAGAASNSTQNALVNRVSVSPTGVVGYSPQDVAATPVEPTTTLKMFAYNKSVADDGIVTLPAVTTNGWGIVIAGDASVRTQFAVDATGTVTLVNNTASVVANADTDANLCIGTAATQEPLQVKNRLGATRVLNIIFWYD